MNTIHNNATRSTGKMAGAISEVQQSGVKKKVTVEKLDKVRGFDAQAVRERNKEIAKEMLKIGITDGTEKTNLEFRLVLTNAEIEEFTETVIEQAGRFIKKEGDSCISSEHMQSMFNTIRMCGNTLSGMQSHNVKIGLESMGPSIHSIYRDRYIVDITKSAENFVKWLSKEQEENIKFMKTRGFSDEQVEYFKNNLK